MKQLFAILLAVMAVGAECTAQEYRIARDIPYGGDEMQTVDVAYIPRAEGLPVVVWFHGGGLTSGRKELPEALMRDSIVVVGVDYRLLPSVTVEEAIDDAAAAVAWTLDNIADFGGDPAKVVLSGHSAGGYLVDMIGFDKSRLAAHGIDADTIAGLAPLSGQAITHFALRDDPLRPTVNEYAPLYHVRGDCPPVLIISGDRELELYGRYEEQAYLWRMLRLNGHPDATLLEMQGYDHGGMPYPAYPIVVEFVKRVTKNK